MGNKNVCVGHYVNNLTLGIDQSEYEVTIFNWYQAWENAR